MATQPPLLVLLTTLLALLATSATARPGPCNTILFISSTSSFSLDQNPNNFPLQNPNTGPRSLTFFFTEIRSYSANPRPSLRSHNPIFLARPHTNVHKPHRPGFEFDASVGSSVRDRTMDIMSVVGALLFGVGCGALTAATMYLVWSLFSPRRFDYEEDFDSESDADDEDDTSPKKMGYVAIPAAVTTVVPPQAKEVA